ncbi:MAG: hypothetical protein ACRD29_14610 [Acidimicrobiales bacterium]
MNEETTLDRRRLLAGLAWGAAGAAGASAVGAVAVATPASAHPRRTVTYEVACLLNTFTPVLPEGATDPETNFRGTSFFVEGELYRNGTIPDGATDFDPGSASPIGHWLCRGWFINRTGRAGEEDRPLPHVITTQEYLIDRIAPDALFPAESLVSSGLEGGPGVATRAVIGGTGRYHGLTGDVLQHTIGANLTGGPNFRFEFRLDQHHH